MPDSRTRGIIAAAVLGSAIVFLDSTIVTVALARIGEELPSALFGVLEAQSFVYNGYLLTLSALLVLAGALADRIGRRKIFTLGLIGFGLTSVAAGLAPSMELLILARLLQGAAGALLVPGSLAILTASFEGELRGKAIGVWAGASGVSAIIGPPLGGLLVDLVSWRAGFLINVPLVALALWTTASYVEESRNPEAGGSFDWLGAGLLAVAIGGLVFGLIRGQEERWESALPFAFVAAGVAAALAVPLWIARAENPLVPRHLFSEQNFVAINLSTFLIYGSLYVFLYLFALFAQGTLGYNATAAGLAQIPSLVFLALFSSRFGERAARFGARRYLTLGPLMMAAGLLWLTRVPETSAAWRATLDDLSSWVPPTDYVLDILPAMLVFGLGVMVMVAPLTTALMSSVPERNSGVASAFNNAVSRIGPQLVGALAFVVLTAVFTGSLVDRAGVGPEEVRQWASPLNPPADGAPPPLAAAVPAASTDAFHAAMWITAALLAAGAVVNWLGVRDEPVVE